MKQNQKEVWNRIAPEWDKFKTEKDKEVIDFLTEQKGKIIDLGCGSGRYLMKLKGAKMHLVDFSKKMIDFARNKKIDAKFFVADMIKLPFENNSFDAAICIASLHCIKTSRKREKAIKELFRVLKSKAKCLVGVWNINSRRFKNSSKEKYINWRNKGERYYYLYDEKEIHDLFEKNGFEVLKSKNKGMMIYFVVEKTNS